METYNQTIADFLADGCGIHGTLPASASADNLETLVLNDNSLSGTIAPAFLASMPRLKNLILSSNRALSGVLPNSLESLLKIKAILVRIPLAVNLLAFSHCLIITAT